MKKIVAILLLAMLALSAVAMGEEAPFTGYKSNFSDGTDGWYARGTGSAQVTAESGALRIFGRDADWNSPGRAFPLISGSRYKYSFTVRQEQADAAEMMLSVAHTREGVETYENLGRVTATRGAWVKMEGEFIAGNFEQYVLYVETVGQPVLEYKIKDILVEPMGIVYDMTMPSLAQAYAPYFDFGCAVSQYQVSDAKRMKFYAHQFNIMTHENALKPDAVLDVNASRKLAKEDDTAVAVHFNSARPLLDYCKKNGIKVHGHVLVWHSQTPDVFFREGYLATGKYVSREVMLARLDNYIRLVMEYMETNYPGVIVSWDVVNEAVADNSPSLRASNWTRVVGQDFVNRAFEIARKYAPADTKLYYNDYSTPYEPKLTGICNLLDSLVAEGNIDGYGFQCHYSSTSPSPSALRRAMQRIADKGLRLRVSELDVGISSNTELNQRIQAYKYADFMKVFMEFADRMDAVQVWGVTDNLSWRADEFPLLFDNKVRPKPAFYSVLEVAQPEKE